MKVLPFSIRIRMSHEALIKAIRGNFEALASQIEANNQRARAVKDDAAEAQAEADAAVSDAVADGGSEILERVNAELDENGVGNPDGEAPDVAPANVQVTPGINYDLWLTWDMIANNSPASYVVERKTGAGGTFAEVHETPALPGQADGGYQFHDTGLALGTAYYYRVQGKDADGVGPYSAEVGPFQVNKTVGEQIADATIDLATKVQGLLPNTNLSQITDPAKLADAIVTGAKIAAGTIDASSKLVAGTIVGNLIAADAIAATHLAAGSVVAGKIATNAIVAGNIQSGQIQTGHMVADSINGDRIAAGTLTAGKIIAGTITATQLATDSVTADKILAGSVTGDKITGNAIDGKTFTGGSYTSAAAIRGSNVITRLDSSGLTFDSTVDASITSNHTVSVSEIHMNATRVFIAANLYHTGSLVGFYNVAPTSRASVTLLSGTTSTNADLHNKVNNLLTKLSDTGIISN